MDDEQLPGQMDIYDVLEEKQPLSGVLRAQVRASRVSIARNRFLSLGWSEDMAQDLAERIVALRDATDTVDR